MAVSVHSGYAVVSEVLNSEGGGINSSWESALCCPSMCGGGVLVRLLNNSDTLQVQLIG